MAAITYTATRGLSLLGDEVGAWMADTTAETLVGAELCSDTGFNTAGDWSGSAANWSISGSLATSNGSSGFLQNTNGTVMVVGVRYISEIEIKTSTSGTINLPYDTGTGNITVVSAVGIHSHTFIATSASVVNAYSNSFNGTVDNLRIRLAVPDLSTAANGLGVYGSITKAAVATGAELMGYSGAGLGGELVTNGGFTTDASWSKGTGWDINSTTAGKAHKAPGTASNLTQGSVFTIGDEVIITFTISGYVAGTLTPYAGGTSEGTPRNANGTYTERFTVSGDGLLYITAVSTFEGDIDDVSVKPLNVLEQPYNADLDFDATTQWCYMGWSIQGSHTLVENILSWGSYSGGWVGPLILVYYVSGTINFYISDDAALSNDAVATTSTYDDSVPHHIAVLSDNSFYYIYVDGVFAVKTAVVNAAGSLVNTGATLRFGLRTDNTLPNTNGVQSLWRAFDYAPTAAQIKSIYDKEKHLFNKYAAYTQEGQSYSIDLKTTTKNRSTNTIKKDSVTLSGKMQSIVHRDDNEWNIGTKLMHRTETTNHINLHQFREFIYSTRGSEQFTYDPYGTVASEDEPIIVLRLGAQTSEAEEPFTDYFRASIKLREV